jgi:hypothetical protein
VEDRRQKTIHEQDSDAQHRQHWNDNRDDNQVAPGSAAGRAGRLLCLRPVWLPQRQYADDAAAPEHADAAELFFVIVELLIELVFKLFLVEPVEQLLKQQFEFLEQFQLIFQQLQPVPVEPIAVESRLAGLVGRRFDAGLFFPVPGLAFYIPRLAFYLPRLAVQPIVGR